MYVYDPKIPVMDIAANTASTHETKNNGRTIQIISTSDQLSKAMPQKAWPGLLAGGSAALVCISIEIPARNII